MSELRLPTDAEKQVTANVLKNVKELLKKGLFFGENSGYVHEAINWLEKVATDVAPKVEPEAEKAELKVVADEVSPDGQA